MTAKKVHMEFRPGQASCSNNDTRYWSLTTDPEKVDCRVCLNGMAGSYRSSVYLGLDEIAYADFFHAHPDLMIRFNITNLNLPKTQEV